MGLHDEDMSLLQQCQQAECVYMSGHIIGPTHRQQVQSWCPKPHSTGSAGAGPHDVHAQ